MPRKLLSFLRVTRPAPLVLAVVAVLALSARAAQAIREHGGHPGPAPAHATGDGQAAAAPSAQQGDSRPGPGGGRGVPGAPEPRAFWRDAEMARQLGLTPVQIKKLDHLYEQRLRQIQPMVDEYKRLKSDLDQMFRDRTAKPEDVELQARRLTYPQMEVVVSRIRLLYEMSQVITPEQNHKLQAIFERERRERDQQGRGRGPGGNLPRQ